MDRGLRLGAFLALTSLGFNRYNFVNNSSKEKIAEFLEFPTDFAISKDDQIFITEKGGNVWFMDRSSISLDPVLKLPVNDLGERGLVGITLDPDFISNPDVYFFYVNRDPLEIRISKFTFSENSIDQASEKILLSSSENLDFLHIGGGIKFGSDNKLWVAVGDNGKGENAQDLTNIHGKILRMNSDGTYPLDNPFIWDKKKHNGIWAYGFRNPFRLSFLPDSRPIVGDVGSSFWEEVNIVEKGENYGWPFSEGECVDCEYKNPIYSYARGEGGAIIGGFFDKDRNYFFADLMRGYIKKIKFDEEFNVLSDEIFDDQADLVVSLQQHKGSLYYLSYYPGALYKIGI